MMSLWRTERTVREAVAEGARLRRRAVLWTSATVALASIGATYTAIAAWSGGLVVIGLALLSFTTVPAVSAYWAWRDVRRGERRVVDGVSRATALGAPSQP